MASGRHQFSRSRRVRSRLAFAAVFDAKARESRFPLALNGVPNGLAFSRIGLSTPRHLGNAVRRNRIRRLLREAFRLIQAELPAGYDWVVVARPHEPLALGEYQSLLRSLTSRLDTQWRRRRQPADPMVPP